jgi:hypothetical protein
MSFTEPDRPTITSWEMMRSRWLSRQRMAIASAPVVLILALLIFLPSRDPDAGEEWTERPHRFVETDVRLAAAELGRGARHMIDSRRMLDDVTANGREITQSIHVYDSMAPMDVARVRPQIEAATRAQACADPRMRMIIDRGGRFTWRYDFLSGHEFRFSVTACPPA